MQAKLVQADNGYFEVWEDGEGVPTRISTEDRQISLRAPGARAAFHASIRERLSYASEQASEARVS